MLETLDYTIHIGSKLTYSYFDLYAEYNQEHRSYTPGKEECPKWSLGVRRM